MRNKTEKLLRDYVTRRTENDVTRQSSSIQVSANQPA